MLKFGHFAVHEITFHRVPVYDPSLVSVSLKDNLAKWHWCSFMYADDVTDHLISTQSDELSETWNPSFFSQLS